MEWRSWLSGCVFAQSIAVVTAAERPSVQSKYRRMMPLGSSLHSPDAFGGGGGGGGVLSAARATALLVAIGRAVGVLSADCAMALTLQPAVPSRPTDCKR